jgi:hypothetical protein
LCENFYSCCTNLFFKIISCSQSITSVFCITTTGRESSYKAITMMLKLPPIYTTLVSALIIWKVEAFAGVDQIMSAAKRRSQAHGLSATETISFQGDFTYTSKPIEGCSGEEIRTFFTKKETRDLFISAGGKRPLSEQSLTPELSQLWTDACENMYGLMSLPTQDVDELINCQTIIKFPGLQVTTTILNGVKFIDDEEWPAYEFVLIGEKKEARGAPPAVWIFNKLTGNDKVSNSTFHPPDAQAKSVVTILEETDGTFRFHFVVTMQIKVLFPKLLLKIMLTSKDNMEKQGSEAVLKTVSKDVIDSVDATRNEFLRITQKKLGYND